GRRVGEVVNPPGNHDAISLNGFAVREEQAKPAGDRLDRRHGAGVDVERDTLPEGVSVGHEIRERNRARDRLSTSALEVVEGRPRLRVADVRSGPGAPEEHSLRHVSLPEGHRLAEYARTRADAPHRRRGPQTVWARPDDDGVGSLRRPDVLPPARAGA